MPNVAIPDSLLKQVVSLGTGTHLFVKVPGPGDSEGTFLVFSYFTLIPRPIGLKLITRPNKLNYIVKLKVLKMFLVKCGWR